MGDYYNFKNVERIRMGEGPAKISEIARTKIVYIDGRGVQQFVDLEESARTCGVLERTGAWPPPEDLDWTAYAAAHSELSNVRLGLVGMRGAVDEPPWFQFFDRRRTLFEFKDRDTIYSELITPMARHGWQTWDGS
jgi:hypothetical protein